MSLFGMLFGAGSEDFCEEGLAALGRRDFPVAAQAFEACLERSRRESTIRLARFYLAECYAKLAEAAWLSEEFEKAKDRIDASLTFAKPTAERHLIAAQIARRLEDRIGASYHLEAALAMVPGNEQALALQALGWYEEGRLEDALANAEVLRFLDGRANRFREAHERGDAETAKSHLLAVASGFPESLL